jgi:putative hemolysin
MSAIRLVVAESEAQIVDAQSVRHRVYVDEERLLDAPAHASERELDGLDFIDETRHLIVYCEKQPVGTVRLSRTSAQRPSLDLESKFRLSGFSTPNLFLAEVTRYCVLSRYRSTRVAAALFTGLLAESARLGISHWVAAANMQTDSAEDAAIAHQLTQRRGLGAEHFRAEPREPDALLPRARCNLYDLEQRSRAARGDYTNLELPRTLSLFATRLGARYMGPPVYDPYFNIFALPLVAVLVASAETGAQVVGARTRQIGSRLARCVQACSPTR